MFDETLINPEALAYLRDEIERIKNAFAQIMQTLKEAIDAYAADAAQIMQKDKKDTRKEWREAALVAGRKGTARAKEYGLRMRIARASWALRRRKRLHVDKCFPDW